VPLSPTPGFISLSLAGWRAAAGQIHNSLNRSIALLGTAWVYIRDCRLWRSVSIPVFVHYILCSLHAGVNVFGIGFEYPLTHRRATTLLSACLSARDLQQQFLCVHAAWTWRFSCRHTWSEFDTCRCKTQNIMDFYKSNFEPRKCLEKY
jgi:hypothetical protein